MQNGFIQMLEMPIIANQLLHALDMLQQMQEKFLIVNPKLSATSLWISAGATTNLRSSEKKTLKLGPDRKFFQVRISSFHRQQRGKSKRRKTRPWS